MLHPTIARLQRLNSAELLNSEDVGEVLGMTRKAASLIIKAGRIEASSFGTRAEHNKGWRVSHEALLRYIVANTTGDKAVLMASIAEAFPHSTLIKPAPAAATNSTKTPRKGNAGHPDQMSLFDLPPITTA